MTIFQLLIPESIGLKSIICIFVICKRPKAYCALLKDADAQTPRHHPAVWSWRGSCRIKKERLAAQQAQLWGARGLDSREKSFIFKEFRPKAKKKFSACLQTTDVNVGPRGEVVDGRPTSNTLHMKAVCKSFGAFEELYGPPTNLVWFSNLSKRFLVVENEMYLKLISRLSF